MILLDTNVISELMRAKPAQIVLDWFGQHDATDLFISAVTEAELRTGVAILPDGQRRDRLQLAIDAMIDQDFQGRVLPFDSLAAKAYAEIAAQRRATGRPIAEADCQIAAIARATPRTRAVRRTSICTCLDTLGYVGIDGFRALASVRACVSIDDNRAAFGTLSCVNEVGAGGRATGKERARKPRAKVTRSACAGARTPSHPPMTYRVSGRTPTSYLPKVAFMYAMRSAIC